MREIPKDIIEDVNKVVNELVVYKNEKNLSWIGAYKDVLKKLNMENKKDNKVENKEEVKKEHHFFRTLFFVIVLLIALIIIYGKFIETRIIFVNEYDIQNEKIPASFNGFEIGHFSDILYSSTDDKEDIK